MLGDPTNKQLKTKGAETWGVLILTEDTRAATQHRLLAASSRFLEAARALIGMVEVLNRTGVHMPPVDISSCRELYERHLTLTDDMPELAVPKRHILMHIVEDYARVRQPSIFQFSGRSAEQSIEGFVQIRQPSDF